MLKIRGGLFLVLAGVGLCGCTATLAPYRVAIKGMAETGDAVRANCIKDPLTPGERALVDAWGDQLKAAHGLVDGGK